MANPYLMHDNLPLSKGVEKGGTMTKQEILVIVKNVLLVVGHLILTFASLL